MKATIVIRFTNSDASIPQIKDLDIPLSVNLDKDDINKLVSTTWLKLIIRNKVSVCEHRRLRLIYNGRVLNQTTNFKKDVFEPKFNQLKQQPQEEAKIYIHCVVGDELSVSQLNEENQLDNQPQQVSTTPQVIGFDRLLQQGFSQDDVSDLRRQFHEIYLPSFFERASNEINDVEEEERRQRFIQQLEERWIESTINNNEPNSDAHTETTPSAPTTATETTTAPVQAPAADLEDSHGNEDLLLGLTLGILLGVVSLIFLIIDDTVFNKRQKMSVVVGIFVNFSFAIVRGQWI